MHVQGDHEEREDRKRNVDEEEPAPAEVLGDVSARRGPDDRSDTKGGAHHPLVLTALARRDDVANDGLRQRHDEAHPGALHETREHEEPEVRRQAGQCRADGEHDDAGHIAVSYTHLTLPTIYSV